MFKFFPLTAFVFFVGCSGPEADPWNATAKPKVMATFAPYQCFALNVYGDSADVRSLLGNRGPHDAEIPTGQLSALHRADVLYANGLKVDDSIVRKSLGNAKDGPRVIKLGKEIPKEKLKEGKCACCNDEEHDHSSHTHTEIDGHVWLGLEQAKIMVTAMAVDAKRDAAPFLAKLSKLEVDGKEMLKDKKQRTIIPFHGSLTYFANNFDLKLTPPIQEVPGQEPSKKHLDELIAECVKTGANVIAVEPQYGAERGAKALFEALKAKGLDPVIVTIDPLETCPDGEMNDDWYEKKMRGNLDALVKALK